MITIDASRMRTAPSALEEIPKEAVETYQIPDIEPNDVMFLQFTSGSTSAPKGVMVTHGSLVQRIHQCLVSFGMDSSLDAPNTKENIQNYKMTEYDQLFKNRQEISRGVRGDAVRCFSWLPMYHDTGLIGFVCTPIFFGVQVYQMSPLDFIRRPHSWLWGMTKYKTLCCAAPNFAFEVVARKMPEAVFQKLDLRHVCAFLCGAEPVRALTIKRFCEVGPPSSSSPLVVVRFCALLSFQLPVKAAVVAAASTLLGKPPDKLPDFDAPLLELGVDSMGAVEFAEDVSKALELHLEPTLIFNYPTLNDICLFLVEQLEAGSGQGGEAQGGMGAGYSAEPVAVVGAACGLPGGIDSLGAFWDLLMNYGDANSDIPWSRWAVDDYYYADLDADAKMDVREGGFVDSAEMFDASFFRIGPSEAKAMFPQQRIMLEVAYESLHSAGYTKDSLMRQHVGVFVGCCANDWYQVAAQQGPHISTYSATSSSPSILSDRILYILGIHGPSCTIDTACSSSLFAINFALHHLRDGSCVAAAAGVNLILAPSVTIAFYEGDISTLNVPPSEEADPSKLCLVSCGKAFPGVTVRIVDPDKKKEMPENKTGEVWVLSASCTRGYFNLPDKTKETFYGQCTLAKGRPSENLYLRTGDSGFIHKGELFIAGRIKDMLIVRGRNYFPQDIEEAVEDCASVRKGCIACYSLDIGGTEKLGIAAEIKIEEGFIGWLSRLRPSMKKQYDEVCREIAKAVSAKIGLPVFGCWLLKPRVLPKTSAGKVHRSCSRVLLPDNQTKVKAAVVAAASELLGKPPDKLPDFDAPLLELGVDSMGAVEFAEDVSKALELHLEPTLIFNYPTLNDICLFLVEQQPVAVVGAACGLPGGIDSLGAFWDLLMNYGDAISEIPRSRWDVDDYYYADLDADAKMDVREGGFVDSAEMFDASFFRIGPSEAKAMYPQQRIMLEVAYESLHSAGYTKDSLMRQHVGVFVGCCANDWYQVAAQQGPHISTYPATSSSPSILSNRISYILGIHGPSCTIDTACSSSLFAINLALHHLRDGSFVAATAGGVNLNQILAPSVTIAFCEVGPPFSSSPLLLSDLLWSPLLEHTQR
uniref:Carrier domain-containing protein n=1 Tax=Chromera velia CCMP2878 TaxID=1169474 RepID=A0A0G4H0W3_9ALVE